MANRWVEPTDLEILKARPVILGREREQQKERIGGYNLRAPSNYNLGRGKTMQFRSVPKTLRTHFFYI